VRNINVVAILVLHHPELLATEVLGGARHHLVSAQLGFSKLLSDDDVVLGVSLLDA
jgi:hypothetical protein